VADDHEYGVRLAAIQHVHALRDANDGFVTWAQLNAFRWGGVDVPLIGASGIWKPAVLSAPISITTSPSDPYGDDVQEDGLLRYRYFGGPGDENSHFNAGLRRAFHETVPLIYFRGVRKGLYQALAPVVITGARPGSPRTPLRRVPSGQLTWHGCRAPRSPAPRGPSCCAVP
jgi:putative restriction endonuclease